MHFSLRGPHNMIIASQATKTESDMAGARARAGQLSAWPRRLPGRRARVRRQLDRSQQTPNFRSCCGGRRKESAGWRARARRPAGPYPQYVDDGQLALGVALLMGSARSFLQRRPWVSTPRREGAADVPAGPDDAPFLLKVRWLLEALFHPLRAAPWHVAEGDAWGSDPGWTAA